MNKHKVSLIGAGSMGLNHLRMAMKHSDFSLVGIFDVDLSMSKKKAKEFGVFSFKTIEEAIENSDACVIATPTSSHIDIAQKCLEKNRYCLIEKPVASSCEEALKLCEICEMDRVMVGYIERYNPVIQELKRLLSDKDKFLPKAVSMTRLSYNKNRSIDIGVVLDLMSHDIDLMNYIFAENFNLQYATNSHFNASNCEDYSHAIFRNKDGGIIVDMTASRITQTKKRMVWISCEDTFITADLLNRRLIISSNDNLFSHDGDYRYIHSSSIDEIYVQPVEPLQAEYDDFSRLVSGEKIAESNMRSAIETLDLCGQIISN